MKKTLLFLFLMNGAFLMAQPARHVVSMGPGDVFSPATLSINAGDTVVWVNNDTDPHTSTSGGNCTNSQVWDSGTVAAGQTFYHVFTTAGTFPYHCTFHCHQGMTGTITVTDIQINSTLKTTASNIQLKAFPNPFHESLKIELEMFASGAIKIEMVDGDGKIMFNTPEKIYSPGIMSVTIPSEGLKEGLFVCRIYVDGVPALSRYLLKYNE